MAKPVDKAKRKPPRPDPGEQPADLQLWWRNGSASFSNAHEGIRADTKVSIGRTNSKKAMGFFISRGDTSIDFVLNKEQVRSLITYLRVSLSRLKKTPGAQRDLITDALADEVLDGPLPAPIGRTNNPEAH